MAKFLSTVSRYQRTGQVSSARSGTSIPGEGNTLTTTKRSTAKSTNKTKKTTRSVAKSTASAKSTAKSKSKQTSAKKAVSKKSASKTTPRKVTTTKVVAKKTVAKKTVAKKTVAKKAVAKKTVAKKAVAKKTVAKKTVAKKAVAKKAVAKKVAPKNETKKTSSSKVTKTAAARKAEAKGSTRVSTVSKLKAVKGGGKPSTEGQKKISIAEKLSTSHLVKKHPRTTAPKGRRGLKLVKKGPIKVPATKISRSDSYSSDSKVVTGRFSFTEEESKPLVVAKGPVENSEEARSGAPMMIFKTGDKIVYPGHGVGEIEAIRSTVLDGQEHHIYNITILESGMKVMVPVSQAMAVGIRKIIDKRAIDEVFTILRDRDFKIDTQTWNRRFREYSQKIKTGSVFEIAIVLRDLSVLSVDKELSFGEKKMLDMAESLLVSEIALARSRPHDKVAGELRALFTS